MKHIFLIGEKNIHIVKITWPVYFLKLVGRK